MAVVTYGSILWNIYAHSLYIWLICNIVLMGKMQPALWHHTWEQFWGNPCSTWQGQGFSTVDRHCGRQWESATFWVMDTVLLLLNRN
jgi:hypothetical protein